MVSFPYSTISLKIMYVALFQKQAKALEEERDSMMIEEEDSLDNYYSLLQQYKSLKKDVRDIVLSPKYCLPFLQPGRLVSIQLAKVEDNLPSFSSKDDFTWGVIVNFERVKGLSVGEVTYQVVSGSLFTFKISNYKYCGIYSDDANIKPEDASYNVDILTRCTIRKDEVGKRTITVVPLKEPGEPAVIALPISQVKSFVLCLCKKSSPTGILHWWILSERD